MPSLPNLNFLRAFAITLVVVDHVLLASDHPTWHGIEASRIGLFGVFLFFVHTSLVLMWSLERRPNVLDFYVRRAFRIYPLAWFAIGLAAATRAPVAVLFQALPFSIRSLLLNLTLVGHDLFHQLWILGVSWSLGLEVLMYFLLPALFFYARAVRKIWPLLTLWLLVVLILHRLFGNAEGNSFEMVIPDFLAGVIGYVAFMKRKAFLPAWTFAPFLLLLTALFVVVPGIRFDWYATLAVGLTLPLFRQYKNTVVAAVSHQIAEHSYGIYLLHSFGLVVGFYVLRSLHFPAKLAVCLAVTVGAAIVSYRTIERPLIQIGARLAAYLAAERPLAVNEDLEPAP